VTLGEKLRHLRVVEGLLRGYGRPLSKAEVVRAMQRELGQSVSHAYLSQLEAGVRQHLSVRTRDLLARFFRIHPGYLVSDPPGYEAALTSGLAGGGDRLRTWLQGGAEEFAHEPPVAHVLQRLARATDPRGVLQLLDHLLDLPDRRREELLALVAQGDVA